MRLRVLRIPEQDRIYVIDEGENYIGRWDPDTSSFPEIDLESVDVESKVSRRHAVIRRSGTKAQLTDLGSLNGTFINRGRRMEEGESVELKSGDEIIVGKTFLRFELELS